MASASSSTAPTGKESPRPYTAKFRTPFTDVRVDKELEAVEVQIQGRWFTLLSLNHVPLPTLVTLAQDKLGPDWPKHFNENLPLLLEMTDHPLKRKSECTCRPVSNMMGLENRAHYYRDDDGEEEVEVDLVCAPIEIENEHEKLDVLSQNLSSIIRMGKVLGINPDRMDALFMLISTAVAGGAGVDIAMENVKMEEDKELEGELEQMD